MSEGGHAGSEPLQHAVALALQLPGQSRFTSGEIKSLDPAHFSFLSRQTTLLHFWEKTAHAMSGIQEAFQGHVQYQFTTLKVTTRQAVWKFTSLSSV